MVKFTKLVLGLTTLAGAAALFTTTTIHADSSTSLEQKNEQYLYGTSSSSKTSSSDNSNSVAYINGFSKASSGSKETSDKDIKQPVSKTAASKVETPNLSDYNIASALQYRLRVVKNGNDNFLDGPYSSTSKVKGSTSDFTNQLVQPISVATYKGNTYFDVRGLGPKYGNQDLGWINAKSLGTTSSFELPFTYSSQLYPTYAPDACEAVSLLMALSVYGYANNVTTKQFIDGIPRSSNPNKGYTADPYRHGSHATIYPAGLANYATKWTHMGTNISGASKNKLIYEIRHGNPVVFEGSWRMQQTKSDHILALVGYKPGYFKIADPYMRTGSQNKVFWTSTSNFMSIFNTKKRGSRAMALVQTANNPVRSTDDN